MSDDEMKMIFPVELSERELHMIGMIVAQWGGMEHEIFVQTLFTYEDANPEDLPKTMNNAQFSKVLDLWSERVIETSEGERREVLRKQLAAIKELGPHRHALVHGMWDYDKANPDVITAIRVRDKEVISHKFTADDLQDFSMRLGVINFRIRYPMGIEDLAKAAAESGGYISRAAVAMFSGHPIASELLPKFMLGRAEETDDGKSNGN